MANEDRLPSLNAIHTFTVAARHLSFTKAAQELHVTHGAVSRMVRALEADVGFKLFRRVGRSVELTPAGAAYYPQIADAFGQIATATRSVRALNGGNMLSIAALPSLAMRCLAPTLHRFQREHPDILVDVIAKDGPIDFSLERIDVGICYGNGRWNGAQATLLMREEIGVFCSPGFLRHGVRLRAPMDLPKHRLLVHSTRPDAWSTYLAAFGVSMGEPTQARFEHFFMIVEAAAAGMGVALLPTFLARPEVTSGRLIQAFPQMIHPQEAYYVLHAPESATVRKIRLFKAWLLEEARNWAPGEG